MFNRQYRKFREPLSFNDLSTIGLTAIGEKLDGYEKFEDYMDDIKQLARVYSEANEGKEKWANDIFFP